MVNELLLRRRAPLQSDIAPIGLEILIGGFAQ